MNIGNPSDPEPHQKVVQPSSQEKEHRGRNPKLQPIFTASTYQGPIPPALEAESWNMLVEGAAERILVMAEGQAAHRQELERKQLEHAIQLQLIEADGRRRELELNHNIHQEVLALQARRDDQRNAWVRMGQFFGLFLGSGALFVACYLGIQGQPWVAALMGTGGLAGIIWASVSGGKRLPERGKSAESRISPQEEREQVPS